MIKLIGKVLGTAAVSLICVAIGLGGVYLAFEFVLLPLWNFVVAPLWSWWWNGSNYFVAGHMCYPNYFGVYRIIVTIVATIAATAICCFAFLFPIGIGCQLFEAWGKWIGLLSPPKSAEHPKAGV